jgi:hypothetical protein
MEPQSMTCRLTNRLDGRWIVDSQSDSGMGPYRTKREAQDDLTGLRRSEPMLRKLLAASGKRLQKVKNRYGL